MGNVTVPFGMRRSSSSAVVFLRQLHVWDYSSRLVLQSTMRWRAKGHLLRSRRRLPEFDDRSTDCCIVLVLPPRALFCRLANTISPGEMCIMFWRHSISLISSHAL